MFFQIQLDSWKYLKLWVYIRFYFTFRQINDRQLNRSYSSA